MRVNVISLCGHHNEQRDDCIHIIGYLKQLHIITYHTHNDVSSIGTTALLQVWYNGLRLTDSMV